MADPKNKKLYNRVRVEAKRKFEEWPSAAASAWMTREYKKRGGEYKGSKPRKSDLDKEGAYKN